MMTNSKDRDTSTQFEALHEALHRVEASIDHSENSDLRQAYDDLQIRLSDIESIVLTLTEELASATHTITSLNTLVATERTRRKKAEDAIWERESRFELVVHELPLGIALLDAEENFMLLNKAFQQIVGYTLEDIPTLEHWWQLAYPNEESRNQAKRTWYRSTMRIVDDGKKSEPKQWKICCKDGSTKDVEILSVALGARVLVVLADLTERKQAEEDRDRIFQYSLDLLSMAGFDGRFREISPSWTETLGWSEEELKAKYNYEFIHPDDLDRTFEAAFLLLKGEPVVGFENRYLCKDGTYRWLSWNSFPVLEREEAFGVARDITEQKRLELERENLIEELRKALERIKTLRGLLPICANCKKIRDDQGYWHQVEVYVKNHAGVEFSHGICPECAKVLYPDVEVE